jgi:hypothetical protein
VRTRCHGASSLAVGSAQLDAWGDFVKAGGNANELEMVQVDDDCLLRGSGQNHHRGFL